MNLSLLVKNIISAKNIQWLGKNQIHYLLYNILKNAQNRLS